MSLITSAKSVKLHLKPSYSFLQVNASLLVLTCCFIALSQLPLVVTLYLVLWLVNHDEQHGLLAPCLLGEVTFHQDGRVQQGEHVMHCKRVLLILPEWFLLLKLDQNWYLLWRDSANNQAYWQLMLQLKKEP